MHPNRRVFERACALLLGCLFVSLPAYASGAGSSYAGHQIVAGDFNGDGMMDFILQPTAGYQGSAEFLAYANGNFGPPVAKWPDESAGTDWNAAAHDIVVGDFNGDGRDDLLLQGIAGHQSRLFLASAQGTFDAMSATLPAELGGLSIAQARHRLIVGDFNGDGRDDLLLQARSFVGTNGIVLAAANGTFTGLAAHWSDGALGLGWSADQVALSAGDFSGDHHAELLVRSRDVAGAGENCCELVKLNQAEQPGAIVQSWSAAYLGVPWDPATETVVTGDLNGDGRADLLLQPDAPGGTAYVLLADAKGEFTKIADQWPSQQGGTDWSAESYRLVIEKAAAGQGGALLMIPTQVGLPYRRAQFNRAGALVGVHTVTAPPIDALDPASSGGESATGVLSASNINLAVQSASANTSGNSTGALPGSGAVSGGAATYSIPIAVPPGRVGMAPSLSLDYSSTGGDGHEGVGWSLGGLSAIYRCPATQASDGETAGVSFSSKDHFCLDGQKLMLASGTYGAAGSVYHAEVNGFATITAQGNVGTGSGYFTVTTPDGRTLTYGDNSDAELLNGSTVFSWSLYQVQDGDGNSIQYEYNKSGGENWLTDIKYTEGNGGDGGTRLVHLVWESRTGAGFADITHYLDGMTLQTTQLLTSITTSVAGTDVRSYTLSYSASNATQRPLLSAVQECGWSPGGGAQQCLPASTFSYQGDHPLVFAPQSATAVSTMGLVDHTLDGKTNVQCSISGYGGWSARDLNGDGRDDLYEAFGSAGSDTDPGAGVTNIIQYAKPGGGYTAAQSFSIAAPSGHSWYQSSDPIDFNLDGRTDILIQDWDGTTSDSLKMLYTTASAPQTFHEYNTGITLPSDTIQATPYVADVNGDGKPDIVVSLVLGSSPTRITGYKWQLYLASGTGTSTTWSLAQTLPTSTGAVYGHVLDYDANGRQDLLVRDVGDAYYTLLRSTRSSSGAITLVAHTTNIPYVQTSFAYDPAVPVPLTTADLNGDSLPDVVEAEKTSSGAWHWFTYINQGLSSGQFIAHDSGLSVASADSGTYPMFSFVKVLHDPDGRDDLILPTARTYVTPILSTSNCIHGTDKCNPGTPVTIPNCGTYDSYRQDFSPQAFDGYDWTLYRTNVNASGIPSFSSDGVVAQNLTAGPFMIDFDSSDSNPDGLTDILGVNAALMGPKTIEAYQLSFAGGGTGDPSPDLLFSVVNGYGAETSFSYAPLTDQAVYTDTATSSYPNMIFASPMQVAASMSQSNPTGGLNTDDYTYANAAYNVEGRGFLGFGKVTDADTAAGTVTETDRAQDFPLIGRVTQRTTWTPANQGSASDWLSQEIDSWQSVAVESHQMVYDASQTDTSKDPSNGYSEIKSTSETQSNVDDCGNAGTSKSTVDDAIATSKTTRSDTYSYSKPETCENDFLKNDDATTVVAYSNAPVTTSSLKVTTAYTYFSDHRVRTKTVTTTGLSREWSYTYNKYGDRTKVTETAGNGTRATSSTYTTYSGYFADSVTNALSQTSHFTYDPGTGNKLSATDPNGIATAFTYDGFGRSTGGQPPGEPPVTVGYIKASAVGSGAACPNHAKYATERTQSGYPTVYACFDAFGEKLRTARQGFVAGSWIYRDATYDALGRVQTQSQPYYPGDTVYRQLYPSYDVLNRPLEVDKPGGLVITMTYAGLRTNYKASDGSTQTTHTYAHIYDGLGNKPRLARVVDADNGTAYYRYDAGGNLIRVVDPMDNTISATYDGFGDKRSLSDPDKGRWSYAYDGFGDLQSVTDVRNKTIRYTYDALGRRTRAIDSTDKRVTNYYYDTAANGIGAIGSETVSVNGTVTYQRQYTYDSAGRPTGTETTVGGTTYAASTSYDSYGHLATRTYPMVGLTPTVTISVNPTSVVAGTNAMVTWSSTNVTSCTINRKDSTAGTTQSSWASGTSGSKSATATEATTLTFTATCTGPGGTAHATATLGVTASSPPTVTISVQPTSVAVGTDAQVTWSSTNATSCTVSRSNSATGGTQSSWASGTSGSKSATATEATTLTFTATCTGPGGSAYATTTPPLTVTAPPVSAPSLSGPLTVTMGSSYTLSWTSVATATYYEIRINSGTPTQLGNVTSKTYTALTQAQPYSVSYNVRACNATGCGPWSNVQTVTINPNTTCLNPPCLAAVITPTHTGSGLTPTLSPATATGLGVPALTVDYSYDARGYVDQATRSADGLVYAKVTAMDAYGHVTAATELGGDSLVRGYDQATGLALSTEADNTGGTALVKRSYVFDEFGNLMQRSDLIDGSVEKDDYDALNRLHSSTLILGGASATTTYGYDAAGDITSRSDRGTYTYGGAGPHQVTAISDGSTFAYDADGEMTNDNGTTLTWAAFGKAVQVKTAAGTTLGLAYGPDEGRYQKTVSTSGGASETVLYLGAAEVLTVNGQESVRRSVTVAGLSLIDTGGEDAGVLAVVRGSLGSSVGLVNAAGSLVRAMSYGPYGKRRTAGWAAPMSQDTAWTIDTTETDRGYTGQESLDSVGLVDYNARLYDPSLGRFLSVDPLIGHPESTQGINPYSYVENNPLNQTDPTGEDATGTCQTEACPALSGGLGTHEGPREAQAAIQGAVSNGTISAAEGKTLSKVFAGGANTISGLGSAISLAKTLADGNRAMAQTAAQWNSFTAHNASSFNVNTHSQPGGGAPTLAPPAGDGSPSGPNGFQNAAFNFGCGLGIGCSIMDSGANPNGDAYAAGQITGIVFSPVVALGIVVLGDGNPASDAVAGDVAFGDTAVESTGSADAVSNFTSVRKAVTTGKRTFSAADRVEGFERAKDAAGVPRCQYCGTELNPRAGSPSSYEADHTIPYSRGGPSTPDNLTPSCRTCNRSKGALMPDEWGGPP